MEDSFDVINSRSKPLAAYFFTNNEELKKEFVRNVSAGGMLINDTILHVSVEFLEPNICSIFLNHQLSVKLLSHCLFGF